MDHSGLWKKVLDELGLEVSPTTFSSLKKTQAVKVQGEALYVHCSNSGVLLLLQNSYYSLITAAVKKYTGGAVNTILLSSKKDEPTKKTAYQQGIEVEQSIENRLIIAHVSPNLTFENFAVSTSNQMAHAATLAVSKSPGSTYNPLFLWGGVGVGKTHLLHAVGRKIIETTRSSVLYCSTEDFTNVLVESIRTKNTALFRKKYRSIDVLLMDDIQFVSDREFIQEELFNTFNKLQTQGKQIIFTSDKPPKAIKNIEKRLASRFLSGLVIDIQRPDFELKTAILLIKARERGIVCPIEVAKIVAAHLEELRELEGFLLKLEMVHNTGGDVSPDAVEKILLQSGITLSQRHNPKEIIHITAREMGVKLRELKEENRKKNIALTRHIAMYLLKTLTNLTYQDIAALMGKKDHTTVMHGVQKIIQQLSRDENLRACINKIRLYFS